MLHGNLQRTFRNPYKETKTAHGYATLKIYIHY